MYLVLQVSEGLRPQLFQSLDEVITELSPLVLLPLVRETVDDSFVDFAASFQFPHLGGKFERWRYFKF